MSDTASPAIKTHWTALGVMSGSSLDGLDLALCSFTLLNGYWSFKIEEATTLPYSPEFRERLLGAMHGSALDLARLHRDLGIFIGTASKKFLNGRSVDVIGSHGHTLFHLPEEGLTTQIGCGAHIGAVAGMLVVCDFRTMDVALGGQGAPLVPLGEKLLFPDHKAFINLGGIANIAVHGERTLGYDIGPCNQALDLLAHEAGLNYDADGALARSGSVNDALLHRLNALPFYTQPPPRSLGREWFDTNVSKLIADPGIALVDRLCTVVEHIAAMIARSLKDVEDVTLITGGGAHNGFLLERIRALSGKDIVVPGPLTVNFKEALVFAFLGVLRLRNEPTALASVTGASRDSVGGAFYGPY